MAAKATGPLIAPVYEGELVDFEAAARRPAVMIDRRYYLHDESCSKEPCKACSFYENAFKAAREIERQATNLATKLRLLGAVHV